MPNYALRRPVILVPDKQPPKQTKTRFGIEGLDDVLRGGLVPNRLYLIQGDPGVGKTTLALQYLLEGVRNGERVLYVTLSETTEELVEVAASHGWTLDGIDLYELSAAEERERTNEEQSVFDPAEVDLNETMAALLERVERVNPTRVVFDSLSEIRLLAQSALRYRRQILSMKQFFAGRSTTVLLLDDRTGDVGGDKQVQSLSHGVIQLSRLNPGFGATRRQLEVAKLRGVNFRSGLHDYSILNGGVVVFPRLVAAEHRINADRKLLSSGIPSLDALVGGGLLGGSSVLVLGPAGAGKSSLCAQYVAAAACRGERAAAYVFDENVESMLDRCENLSIPLRHHVESGQVTIKQVDPAELSPGEFTHIVRQAVEKEQSRVIVIDSLNGYLNAMIDEQHLTAQMHDLLAYLSQRGVLTFMVVAQYGLLGNVMRTPIDLTYLADTALLLRYFEAAGEVRQAVSVIKNRGGQHERTIREFHLSGDGIQIGPPLAKFEGVLSGTPHYRGGNAPLLDSTPPDNEGVRA
ncbi:MAG: ATPase domain-containing protein [Tepidisphaeraceae bacterium]